MTGDPTRPKDKPPSTATHRSLTRPSTKGHAPGAGAGGAGAPGQAANGGNVGAAGRRRWACSAGCWSGGSTKMVGLTGGWNRAQTAVRHGHETGRSLSAPTRCASRTVEPRKRLSGTFGRRPDCRSQPKAATTHASPLEAASDNMPAQPMLDCGFPQLVGRRRRDRCRPSRNRPWRKSRQPASGCSDARRFGSLIASSLAGPGRATIGEDRAGFGAQNTGIYASSARAAPRPPHTPQA